MKIMKSLQILVSNNFFFNLSCGIVGYKVEKSKHDMDVALLRLLIKVINTVMVNYNY